MRRVYLSFLGLGAKGEGYTPAIYTLNGVASSRTRFVQAAEVEILGAGRFDLAVIVATGSALKQNYQALKKELEGLGLTDICSADIGEDMSAEGQWKCFEEILKRVEHGDHLTVDMTHGYRFIPIVFSAAVNFLKKARNITLDAAYYGAFEKKDEFGQAPIVEMKDFYIVNEWAEAVSRLIEDADARKMARVASDAPGFQTGGLSDPKIIAALDELTNAIRNVDVNRVGEKARTALALITAHRASAPLTGRALLELVVDKFAALAVDASPTGSYDRDYFLIQLEIIKLLLEHKLFMQAYTVMRELIGSIGLAGSQLGLAGSENGCDARYDAEVFVNMFQFKKKKWKFKGKAAESKNRMMPLYDRLEAVGIEAVLRKVCGAIVNYRNGFDHAWTAREGAPEDISPKGFDIFQDLKRVVEKLGEIGMLK